MEKAPVGELKGTERGLGVSQVRWPGKRHESPKTATGEGVIFNENWGLGAQRAYGGHLVHTTVGRATRRKPSHTAA